MAELNKNKPKRFLIGQLARYGDCLFATTIARQIKKDFPDSHITWAIASNFKSILLLNPYVDAIWEISIANGDYYKKGWGDFEKEAVRRKQDGDFDEIIFSQIPPLNWINYTGTIRSTTLSAYKKQITVPVSPVLILSNEEIENVKKFAAQHHLNRFKHVILFECMPASGQANINLGAAISLARQIINKNNEVCFILSSHEYKSSEHPQIISAASLSFRENAELTHYCTMMIGCSSGITWLATSEWAKKIPMLQLYSKKPAIYAGVHHDFEINGLDNSHIIEIEDTDLNLVIEVIDALLTNNFATVKTIYHQKNLPTYRDLKRNIRQLIKQHYAFSKIVSFAKRYRKTSIKNGIPLHINFIFFKIELRFNQFWNSIKKTFKK